MDCEETWNLIAAEMDGELAAADRPRLEAHLAGCAACGSVRDSFRLQDAGLRRAFAGRRKAAAAVAERAIATLRVERRGRSGWRRGLEIGAAAAAGFIVAVLAMRLRPEAPVRPVVVQAPPPVEAPVPPPASAVVDAPGEKLAARLVLANGTVEVLGREGSWAALAEGATISPGVRVRTGEGVLCEFRLSDGSDVRLNESTEIGYAARRGIDLFRGRLWSSVERDDEPFAVHLPASQASVTALGTKFDVRHDGEETSVIVFDGATRFRVAGDEKIVRRGEKATLKDGAIEKRQQEVLLATSWVHKLLTVKGGENPELSERIEELLASIGQEKLDRLYEKEIYDLGESCVRPLLSFLKSKRSSAQAALREKAASILANLAPAWAVPDLIQLLVHEDARVREHAARALERLTGEAQGVPPEEWKKSRSEMEESYDAWLAWWEKNRARFAVGK
jgi:ferric-dicitrate binding protein FerR (iron transport regulator)